MASTILVVEDEPAIQELIAVNLSFAGHKALRAATVEQADTLIRAELPDLILLDWMLPGASGVSFARKLRTDERTRDIPIIMLTARSGESDKIEGLESGADDYITKPFSQRLLIARIRALLRRRDLDITPDEKPEGGEEIIQRGDLILDPARHKCTWRGDLVDLTVTEFLLIKSLAYRPGLVKNRDQLIDAAYGEHIYVDDRTIDSHVKRLRKKFRAVDAEFAEIETLYGVGYRYRERAKRAG